VPQPAQRETVKGRGLRVTWQTGGNHKKETHPLGVSCVTTTNKGKGGEGKKTAWDFLKKGGALPEIPFSGLKVVGWCNTAGGQKRKETFLDLLD